MRIAHFIHRYPPALGGSEAYFARLSRFLEQRGDSVEVWTTNAFDLESFWSAKGRTVSAGVETDDGVTVRRFPLRHWPLHRYVRKLLSLIPSPRWQCRMLPWNPVVPEMWAEAGKAEAVDVVHAGVFPYAYPILCGLRLARRCGAKFCLTPFLHLGNPNDPHDRTRRGYLSKPMRSLLENADHIFVQTELERRAALDGGIPESRLSIIGMGVDPAECTGGDRERGRRKWGIPADAVVVGHLANKSVEKGTVDLLEACQKLWSAGAAFHVVLAGPEMENFRTYERHSPSLALRASVTKLETISEEEKRDFFAAIDVFAMPSRSDSFGIVFLEAWANGVPCAAYRAGGVAEVIRHEADGLLADCGDVVGLARQLSALIADDRVRKKLGVAGRDKVLRDYTWPSRLAAVRHVYEWLVRS